MGIITRGDPYCGLHEAGGLGGDIPPLSLVFSGNVFSEGRRAIHFFTIILMSPPSPYVWAPLKQILIGCSDELQQRQFQLLVKLCCSQRDAEVLLQVIAAL